MLRSSTTNRGYGASARLLSEELGSNLISGEFNLSVLWQPDPDEWVYRVCLDGEDMHLVAPHGDALLSPVPVEQTLQIELVEEGGELMVDRIRSGGQLYCYPPLQ